MANDFIKVTTSGNVRATKLVQANQHLRKALEIFREVKDTLDHHAADPVYTAIEGAAGYGVPTGEGATVYNLVAAAKARLDHADVTNLINRVGE